MKRFQSWLAAWIIRLVGMSLRVRIYDSAGILKDVSSRPYLFAFWHNRILMMPYLYQKYFKKRPIVMISQSRDGQIIAEIAERFEIDAVRGSTSRNAMQAYRQLLGVMKISDRDVGITPDGPRGPRYRAQAGIVSLAEASGYPILPITQHYQWKIELKSWDGFQVPLPFSRCDFHIERPFFIPPDISEKERELARLELERRLGV